MSGLIYRAALAGLVLGVLLGSASPAFAQSQGVVTVDRAIIWRTDGAVPATTVRAGTMLDVTARSDRWYEVIIPENLGGRGERGLISIAQLKLEPGTPAPPVRPLRGEQADRGQPSAARDAQPRAPSGVTGGVFLQVGLAQVEARQSFTAVFGESRGPTFGGGLHVRFRNGFYIAGSFERFQKTGERVFVSGGTVLPLGIPDTLTVVPMTVTAGYRLFPRALVVPYVGAGIGAHGVRETTPFHEEDEVPWEWHDSYRAVGGVEVRANRWLTTAVEGQFTKVRDALGSAGISRDFSEHDLGGFALQFKVLLGR